MLEFPVGYIEYLYEQIATISAVLGGFSIAALSVLLTAQPKRKIASWAAGFAGFAAGFLVSTTFLASILASDAMKTKATSFADLTSGVQSLTTITGMLFPLGIYALLVCLGLTGWVRSKGTGLSTTIAALIGIIIVTVGFFATV